MQVPILSWLVQQDDDRAVHSRYEHSRLLTNSVGVIASRAVLGVVLAGIMELGSAQAPSLADADSMHGKLQLVSDIGARPHDEQPGSVHTAFSDREVNAYLKFYGPTFLPHGLTDPQIAIGDVGRVAVRGVVDLDVVRTARQRDWLDPLSYMGGLLDFTANGVIVSSNGRGIAVFESATLAGVAVPKNIAKELVRYFTATPELPNGLDIDESFDLPARIQSIFFEPGRATVIQ